ncbi:hypothetical protein O9993_00165 [Vibrio lentus]|nr:hypothetical protein [Vibrio lentus]
MAGACIHMPPTPPTKPDCTCIFP